MPFRRLRLVGTKFGRAVAKRMLNHVPADPVVEVVGCLKRGLETVLYRRRGCLGRMRSPGGPAECRHGDAPYEPCFSHRSNRAAARARPVSSPCYSMQGGESGSRHFIKKAASAAGIGWKFPATLSFGFRTRVGPTATRAFSRMEHPARARWLSLRRGVRPSLHCGISIRPMSANGSKSGKALSKCCPLCPERAPSDLPDLMSTRLSSRGRWSAAAARGDPYPCGCVRRSRAARCCAA